MPLTIKFRDQARRYLQQLPKELQNQAIERTGKRSQQIIASVMQEEVPDGVETGNRRKMSKISRNRYPGQIKNAIRSKPKRDTTGSLFMVGVAGRLAGQVNFDHGEKALKGQGREHKLWWIDGVREVWHDPKYRRQTADIKFIVKAKTEQPVRRVFVSEIRKMFASR